jgi:hypothetical protein
VPGVPKTLKRVPELPKAQEGSSMACWLSWSVTAARDGMDAPSLETRVDLPDSCTGRRAIKRFNKPQQEGIRFGW